MIEAPMNANPKLKPRAYLGIKSEVSNKKTNRPYRFERGAVPCTGSPIRGKTRRPDRIRNRDVDSQPRHKHQRRIQFKGNLRTGGVIQFQTDILTITTAIRRMTAPFMFVLRPLLIVMFPLFTRRPLAGTVRAGFDCNMTILTHAQNRGRPTNEAKWQHQQGQQEGDEFGSDHRVTNSFKRSESKTNLIPQVFPWDRNILLGWRVRIGAASSRPVMKRLFALLALVGFCLGIKADDRPNILFIYTDDQSHRTVSCYPEAFDWVNTPNIDSLAKNGVRFSRAYIGSWCMPSRATMLTGLHQHGIESMRMEGQYPGSAYDPEKCPFWPKVFRQHGYTTAQIGKWHTGVDGGFGRDWDYQIIWNRPALPKNAPNYYYDQLTSFNGGKPKMVKGYTTDNYTEWAIEFINGKGHDPQKPWYLWLCYGAVHGPFTPAKRHLNDYPDIKAPTPKDVYPPRPGKPAYVDKMEFWERGKDGGPVERQVRKTAPVGMKDFPGRSLRDWVRQYHQGVLAIDEGVGKLLTALKESGQDENTIIVFTSDQGFAWGQHGFKSKVAPYNGTIAAPFIIRPVAKDAKKSAGRVVESPVSGVDIPPTFFAQAGIDLPWKMHGRDLSPSLSGKTKQWAAPALLVHTAKLYGSATDKIPSQGDKALYHGPGVPWYVMLAQGRYKYVRTLIEGEPEELYDLHQDPDEQANLALKKQFRKQLNKYRSAAIAELKRTEAGFAASMPKPSTN